MPIALSNGAASTVDGRQYSIANDFVRARRRCDVGHGYCPSITTSWISSIASNCFRGSRRTQGRIGRHDEPRSATARTRRQGALSLLGQHQPILGVHGTARADRRCTVLNRADATITARDLHDCDRTNPDLRATHDDRLGEAEAHAQTGRAFTGESCRPDAVLPAAPMSTCCVLPLPPPPLPIECRAAGVQLEGKRVPVLGPPPGHFVGSSRPVPLALLCRIAYVPGHRNGDFFFRAGAWRRPTQYEFALHSIRTARWVPLRLERVRPIARLGDSALRSLCMLTTFVVLPFMTQAIRSSCRRRSLTDADEPWRGVLRRRVYGYSSSPPRSPGSCPRRHHLQDLITDPHTRRWLGRGRRSLFRARPACVETTSFASTRI